MYAFLLSGCVGAASSIVYHVKEEIATQRADKAEMVPARLKWDRQGSSGTSKAQA
jgi:hypothetical protein